MALKYWTGSHTKHRLLFHLVFIPKFRRDVISKPIAIRLKNLFYQACKDNNWWIDELEILNDHVHMLIQIRPSESVSSVVKVLKSGTSRVLRQEFPNIREFLWSDSFWSNGFFAVSVGNRNYASVKKYIQEQLSQHATD